MQSLILHTASNFLLILLAAFSFLVLLRGHNEPGGGFVGGLLLAAGFVLHSLSHGPAATRKLLRVRPESLVRIGLGLATIAALAGLLTEGTPFFPIDLGKVPGMGHADTVLLFDLGVYLLVAGTTLRILLTLAEVEQ